MIILDIKQKMPDISPLLPMSFCVFTFDPYELFIHHVHHHSISYSLEDSSADVCLAAYGNFIRGGVLNDLGAEVGAMNRASEIGLMTSKHGDFMGFHGELTLWLCNITIHNYKITKSYQ